MKIVLSLTETELEAAVRGWVVANYVVPASMTLAVEDVTIKGGAEFTAEVECAVEVAP